MFNVACGDQTTLNEIIVLLREISGLAQRDVKYKKERLGDVKHSKASIEKLTTLCGYSPDIRFKTGLEIVFNWYKNNI